jgi:RimJ/RimL family protein N-acetyltransferase
LEIRPLVAADGPAFKSLRLRAIAETPTAVWTTHREEADRTVEEVEARIRHSATQIVFGGFIDAQLVGIAGLRRETLEQVAHKATLWGVFVSPEARGAGLARTLIARLASWAREGGVRQIHLFVNAENAPAKQLYTTLGFQTYGLEPRALRVGDRYYDEQHMLLCLDE